MESPVEDSRSGARSSWLAGCGQRGTYGWGGCSERAWTGRSGPVESVCSSLAESHGVLTFYITGIPRIYLVAVRGRESSKVPRTGNCL